MTNTWSNAIGSGPSMYGRTVLPFPGPGLAASTAAKPKRRNTVWDKAFAVCNNAAKPVSEETSRYYQQIMPGVLISTYGNINPVYRQKPKTIPMKLLMAVSPIASNYQGHYYCGITYKYPYILGQQKTRFQLTASGLALLDHWAEKFPSFKKFHAAFVNDKQREKILANTVDFDLGVLPSEWEDIKKINAEKVAQAEEERKKREAELQQDLLLERLKAAQRLNWTDGPSSSTIIAQDIGGVRAVTDYEKQEAVRDILEKRMEDKIQQRLNEKYLDEKSKQNLLTRARKYLGF